MYENKGSRRGKEERRERGCEGKEGKGRRKGTGKKGQKEVRD